MQKDHSVAENIQMNIQLIHFNILLGLSLTSIRPTNDIKRYTIIQIFISTSDKLDVIVVGLDEYLLIKARWDESENNDVWLAMSASFARP